VQQPDREEKYAKKERKLPLKQYEVTLTGHFEKTVSIYADSPEQAAEKLKIILFDTDLITFSNEDFVCGEADIKDENEDGCEEMEREGGGLEDGDCSDCPCFCPTCGECMYEGGD
jgi:hypothetical protein